MPKSAGEIAALAVIVLVCIGSRVFLASVGFGGATATVAALVIGLLLIAATLLLKTYPVLGITLYVLMALVAVGLAVYVNAYRNL